MQTAAEIPARQDKNDCLHKTADAYPRYLYAERTRCNDHLNKFLMQYVPQLVYLNHQQALQCRRLHLYEQEWRVRLTTNPSEYQYYHLLAHMPRR